MKLLIDTTVLVDLERGESDTVRFFEEIDSLNLEIAISAVSASELYTGVYLSENVERNLLKANQVIGQFQIMNLDPKVAEETGKLLAYRQIQGLPKYYEDAAIAASAISGKADFLITDNIKDFDFPNLKGKVFKPREFLRALKQKKLKFIR